MAMQDYEAYCQTNYPKKIPSWRSSVYERRMGDCIYDFSSDPPKIRLSVHNEGNRALDLGGKFALISKHFYYFGDRPIALPTKLRSIMHQQQGHKVNANEPFRDQFVQWIETVGYEPNGLYGEPQLKPHFLNGCEPEGACAKRDLEEDEADERISHC